MPYLRSRIASPDLRRSNPGILLRNLHQSGALRMIPRPRSAAFLLLAILSLPVAPAISATLEREFRYDAARFSVIQKGGETLVDMKGAVARPFIPGRPDLPVLSEMIDLPPDVRVTGVEVTSIGTELLAPSLRIPTAARAKPGLAPIERTDPDPAYYKRAGFLPTSSLVTLGDQGWMRGRHIASLRVSPVRWDPASGRLERVSRLSVRLTFEPYRDPDVVPRERIVPEWEASRPAVAPDAPSTLARHAEPFKPTQIPSLLGSPVAYVIITSDALAGEFQRLADWKTESGVPAVVRTLSFIRSQYPYGTDDADRIRQFIRDAYSRWGTKWVLLGGDTDVIPERMIYTTFFGGEHIPCDMYFSCLDGNWNADGDSTYGEGFVIASSPGDNCDLLPEVYVGRAPVVSVGDVQRFVDKNFMYTRTPVGDYENRMMFFAEVLFPQNWTPGTVTSLDGAELVEEVLPSVNLNANMHYMRLYENYTDPRWSPGALQEFASVVLDSIDAGYNMAVHVGHGYRNVMSCADNTIENANVLALTNGNRLTNVYAIDCTSNAIDFPCIGEAFLNAPNGGAVTNIGSTRFDFPHAGRAFQKEYFRVMFDDSVTAVGEVQARQKLPFVGQSVQDNINRWTETTLLMLGDPELHQWLNLPRTLTITKPSTYLLSDTSMTVNVKIGATPLGGAKVTLYKENDDYRSAITDAAGNAVVEFRPGSIGSFTVTVTGFDCRPFQATMTVGAAAAAVLADLTPVIDDDGSGGTQGNSNGQIDGGEVVDIRVPVINRGGTTASAVNGTLSTTDGLVTIGTPAVSYGSIAPSTTANGTTFYRMSIPYTCPDQRELAMKLDLVDNGGHHWVQRFQLTVHTPELRQVSHTFVDSPGNGDGIPNPTETITMTAKIRNLGTGPATAVTAILRNYDGLVTISDSTATFGTIAPGVEVASGDPFVFNVVSNAAALELRVSSNYGLLSVQRVDLARPGTPIGLVATGSQSSISLTWTHTTSADLEGYGIYRSSSQGGPYTRLNLVPTDRTSYYQDEGLAPLTRYFYKVSAIDSSGNESNQSLAADASTNPPNHTIFPVEMGRATPAPVAFDYLYQHSMVDIFAGSDYLWAWHADGVAPIDADGTSVTYGDFTTRGSYYAAGASLGTLDGVNWSVAAPSWDSLKVYVFDTNGSVRPGWPFATTDPVWSGVVIGDLNNDGSRELVFASNGSKFYVVRANGTEWIDGDSNPSTQGVFKVLGASFNYGTPALADLDGNGVLDIVYASTDGNLYGWRPDGTNLPGFPAAIGVSTTASVAVGYLDGPSDAQLEIIVPSNNDSLYVFKSDGGRRPGFPIGRRIGGTSKNPSPVIADMNNDGFNDIVIAGTDGKIHVFDRNGVLFPAFANVRYSTITDGFASESSPVVADINGDGLPDIVMGDENGVLNGISGTGQELPGFPIQLGGEIRGVPGVCDCDGDGLSEIVVSSWDKKTYVWDYDFPFSPGGPPPWPQFHHDARRTGLATSPVFLDAPNPGTQLAPVSIELSAPEPNPARERIRVHWAVPATLAGNEMDLGVYDLAGRRLATLASGVARSGRFDADWDLRTDGGRVGNGVYFLRFRLGATAVSQKLVVMH